MLFPRINEVKNPPIAGWAGRWLDSRDRCLCKFFPWICGVGDGKGWGGVGLSLMMVEGGGGLSSRHIFKYLIVLLTTEREIFPLFHLQST